MWFQYQNSGGAVTTLFLKTLRAIDRPEVEGSETSTLRKRRARTITATWRFWELAIGMDVLYLPANLSFLTEWWAADQCWIHTSTDSTTEPVDSWIEVTPPLGPLPVAYPTGNKLLPSFAATIYETEGS